MHIASTEVVAESQAKDGAAFAARDFTIDFTQQRATCPAGHSSQSWTPAIDRGKNPVIKIKFATADCHACALNAQCTRSTPPRRGITIRPQAQHEALCGAWKSPSASE